MELTYTKEDYLTTTAPFEQIEGSNTPFEKEQMIAQHADHAKSVGVRNFMTLYKQYIKTLKMMGKKDYVENASNFEGQEMELDTGDWMADDYGISRIGYGGQDEIACPHPIMPVLRLNNVDTGMEKMKLAYKRGVIWQSVIIDRKQIASNNLIVGLADYGISVTSENSKSLVRYLHDVDNLNYNRIPRKKSVSRLGWVGNEGCSPYVDDLVFDGENSFKTFYESVQSKGKYEKWIEAVKVVRAGENIIPKIVLAASFASLMIEPCSGLPFFVHMWGTSESGKTVALMLATSVWADPEKGKYWHTLNSTAVGQELSASFVNSLPLILDEMQIVKDRKDLDKMVYQLCEGVGRMRGQKTGGLQKTGTWANCILTSGETPITTSASGGGAVNRVIEINCNETKLFDDPANVVKVIRQNFGHAGKVFAALLSDEKIVEEATMLQQSFYKEINKNSTEKQALSASLILAADFLINEHIFHDDQCISFEQLGVFLSNKDDISQDKRAYEWLLDWVTQNRSKFTSSDNAYTQDCYGEIRNGRTCIIRNVFNSACTENGFNPASFAGWLKRKGLSETDNDRKRNDKNMRLNGTPCRCIVLPNRVETVEFEEVQENIEF